MQTSAIVVVGAGGFGRDVFDLIGDVGVDPAGDKIECLGFLDDAEPDPDIIASRATAYLGTVDDHSTLDPAVRYVLGVGDGRARRALSTRMGARTPAEALIHPTAYVGRHANVLGAGSVVCGLAHISTSLHAGTHVDIHPHVTVGHDVMLADYVTVFPGATISGTVTVGEAATIGAGATVLPGLTIGADAYVGAGAVVVSDVPPGAVVVGVPARRSCRR